MNLTASVLALSISALLTGGSAVPAKQVTPIAQPRAETVREHITAYWADVPLMAVVSGCESHYRQFDTDGSVYRGEQNNKDVGVMQINEHYHLDTATALGYNIYTVDGNLGYARYLYTHEGTAPWSSSEYCWAPNVKDTSVAAKKLAPLATAVKQTY